MRPADEKRLISNMRARDRARWTADHRHARQFPRWQPGMSTSGYVRLFMESIGDSVLLVDWSRIGERAAPYLSPEDDLVIVETEEETEVLW